MRGLTLRQPWATLIAHHGKRIENRQWTTRYRGPLLIHAGLGFDADAAGWARGRPDLPYPHSAPPTGYPAGSVVAVATLTDIHSCPVEGEAHPCPVAANPWAQSHARYHWILTEVRALAEPVPARGALGLWRPSPALVATVRAALG